jgi:glutamate N-acetyltransferase/amino-acid N-acetyltransferase
MSRVSSKTILSAAAQPLKGVVVSLKHSVCRMSSSAEASFNSPPHYALEEYPKGFRCAAVYSGIKKRPTSETRDIALITSDRPCTAAGCFTLNKFSAAPVQVSKSVLEVTGGENIYSVVMNSGCANAVTGEKGLQDAKTMVQGAERALGNDRDSTLLMSTGVIGQHLPIEKISDGIKKASASLSHSHSAWLECAAAFMTTDTFPKLRVQSFQLPSGGEYRLAGIVKGAGTVRGRMRGIETHTPNGPTFCQE